VNSNGSLFSLFQRQKSLVIVNIIDLVIKVVTLTVTLSLSGNNSGGTGALPSIGIHHECESANVNGSSLTYDEESRAHVRDLIVWTGVSASANIILGALALWLRFANLYLHWGALATWFVLFLQGELSFRVSRCYLFSLSLTALANSNLLGCQEFCFF